MYQTSRQLIAGVYVELHRPSQLKLPYEDVMMKLNETIRGYIKDNILAPSEERTAEKEAEITADDIDYRISIGSEDFEPTRLQFSAHSLGTNAEFVWQDCYLSTLENYAVNMASPKVIAAFYGSPDIDTGLKLKINRAPETIAMWRWRLTYRVPLASIVQIGDKPPFPSDYTPLLKYRTALDSLSIVRDSTPEWLVKVERVLRPFLEKKVMEWETRYYTDLNKNNEPQIQPIRPFNWYRHPGAARSTRGRLLQG